MRDLFVSWKNTKGMSEGLDKLDKMIDDEIREWKANQPVVEFASESESPEVLIQDHAHNQQIAEYRFVTREEGRRQWLQALVELNIRYMLGRQHPADGEV